MQLIDTNHVRLQSYFTLYTVSKTLNTTEYLYKIISFNKGKEGDKVYCLKEKLL